MLLRNSVQRWRSACFAKNDRICRVVNNSSWSDLHVKFGQGEPWWCYAFKKIRNYKVNCAEPFDTEDLFLSHRYWIEEGPEIF